jgi:hypothetical protein
VGFTYACFTHAGDVLISLYVHISYGPGVVWWLRHCATSQKVQGSIPGGVTGDFFRGI